jgi:hypothetical protein
MSNEEVRQKDHRRMSRGGIIARPMNPGPWGIVGVVEFFLLPGSAQTPTGSRSGRPAAGWGCSVDVRESFSSSSFARTPTLRSDGRWLLRAPAKTTTMDREPCVGTVLLTTTSQPTHDCRRGGAETGAGRGVRGGGARVGRGEVLIVCSGRPRARTAAFTTTCTVRLATIRLTLPYTLA